jgi:hypothetical protein
MQNFVAAAVVAFALSVLYVVAIQARARSRKGAARSREVPSDDAFPVSEEIVAVIAAAIAAARGDARGDDSDGRSGLDSGSFRIAGISPSADAGRELRFPGQPGYARNARRLGLNTPAWGHVDRLTRGE